MNIKIKDYNQLYMLCWTREREESCLTGQEALAIYERNWRYVDPKLIDEKEQKLIDILINKYGGGIFNV